MRSWTETKHNFEKGDYSKAYSMAYSKAMIASYLSPDAASSLKGTALPSKPLRTTSALLGKGYSAAELRRAADLSLHATKESACAIGLLWLVLSDMKEKDWVFLLDALLVPSGLFSNSLSSVVNRYQEARKQAAHLETIWSSSGESVCDSGDVALSPLVLSESSSSPGTGCHGTDLAEASSIRRSPQLLCSPGFLLRPYSIPEPLPRGYCLLSSSFSRTRPCKLNRMCPVRALDVYVHRAALWRKSKQWFVCFGPFKKGLPASKQPLSRWIMDVKAHSTRGMVASKAFLSGVLLQDIGLQELLAFHSGNSVGSSSYRRGTSPGYVCNHSCFSTIEPNRSLCLTVPFRAEPGQSSWRHLKSSQGLASCLQRCSHYRESSGGSCSESKIEKEKNMGEMVK
ncbi:Cobalt-factor III methyltransferase [Labeo rohita]|uniref:Cobalt-factor III methyltransferase n=1 Tax=Labeo rohita TaxID=84645 RepID=A0ABQ8MDN2_LABRO|nr:Cobalt-factor III methyltransferase [Labeo rohita]